MAVLSFVKRLWRDGRDGGTPITAAELNRIEDAVSSVVTEVNAADSRYQATVSLGSLYRPMTDVLPAGVVTLDEWATSSTASDFDVSWGTRWDSPNLNTQGANLVLPAPGNSPNAGGCNDTSSRYMAGSGGQNPYPCITDIEFLFTGSKLDVMMAKYGVRDMQVYVEHAGQMCKIREFPLESTTDGYVFRRIRFADASTRRIRLIMPTGFFIQLIHEKRALVQRAPDRPLMVVSSDSYLESVSARNPGSARSFDTLGIQEQIIEQTGFAIARCGQGGTGYFNDGTGGTSLNPVDPVGSSPFFSDDRKAAYALHLGATARPVVFLINGTINDGGLSGGRDGMKTRCAAGLQWIRTQDPWVSIAVVGPEPYNESFTVVEHLNNRLGQLDAVTEVRPQMTNKASLWFLDPNNPAAPWFTGTGFEGTPNDSSQAVFTGADRIHTNYYGARYYGLRIANELRNMPVPADRAYRRI